MKVVASLKVDGANCYLVYPEKQNSWGTNGREAKLALLTSICQGNGTPYEESLQGTCEASSLT